ncbi:MULTISPECIES: LacI family DNA-binding transcriptional regulator [Microbacterium]|uniref:LacI family DNA-binding transcriptional regulator n=1 Tax=Microbacterium TaxID=33882 RepID=UPI0003A32B23|nr:MULTISPECIES: LacI family DNA-binding transcriptional regulator [unclassified Microbacterium]MDT3344986.1 LacI family DNA-binding transcriptional regulator [Microbacterium sp. KSW2-22]
MAVSVKDVARAAGVSVGTVSNVLNRPAKVSPATVERVHAAISALGFVRNDAARQLRAGRSRTVGLVVLDTANPFFAEVARGAEERAAAHGVTILLGSSGQDAARENAYLDLFREQRVNGVLLTPLALDDARAETLETAGVPIVLLDAEADGDLPSVAVDDVEGGYLAVQHLLQQGRRRILFAGGPASVRQVADRLEGARRALAEVPEASLEVAATDELTVLAGRLVGEQLARRDAAERPDGVFCANDLLAVGVLQGAGILGSLRVPEDLALIGYDDIDFAQSTVVPLSSIRQPAREIGAAAVDALFALLEDPDAEPQRIRFRPELVVRASTGG